MLNVLSVSINFKKTKVLENLNLLEDTPIQNILKVFIGDMTSEYRSQLKAGRPSKSLYILAMCRQILSCWQVR